MAPERASSRAHSTLPGVLGLVGGHVGTPRDEGNNTTKSPQTSAEKRNGAISFWLTLLFHVTIIVGGLIVLLKSGPQGWNLISLRCAASKQLAASE